MTQSDGGPVFPAVKLSDYPNEKFGMSLRDWFAGMVLSATNPDTLSYGTLGKPRNPWPDVAADCYRAADAMLEERNNGTR